MTFSACGTLFPFGLQNGGRNFSRGHMDLENTMDDGVTKVAARQRGWHRLNGGKPEMRERREGPFLEEEAVLRVSDQVDLNSFTRRWPPRFSWRVLFDHPVSMSGAIRTPGTGRAIGFSGAAVGFTEFHHGLVPIARAFLVKQGLCTTRIGLALMVGYSQPVESR